MNVSLNTTQMQRGFSPGFNSELFVPFDYDILDWSKNLYPGSLVGVSPYLNSAIKKIGFASLAIPLSADGVSFGNVPVGLTNDFCIEAWVFPASLPTYAGVVGKYSTSSGWIMRLNSGYLAMYSYNPGFSYQAAGPPLPVLTWSHIAITRRFNTARFFVNGELRGSAMHLGAALTADPLVIGLQNGWPTRGFIGHVDNVRVSIGHYRYSSPFVPPNRQY